MYTKDNLDQVVKIVGTLGAQDSEAVSITGGTIAATSVQLLGGVGTQGTLTWNTDDQTLDIDQGGVIVQAGQETQLPVINQTGADILDGTPVMAVGAVSGSGQILIAPMDATDPANAKLFLGFCTQTISNGGFGKVTTFGKIRGLNTSMFADGDVLWLTGVGSVTNTKPTTGLALVCAFVVYSDVSQGVLLVRTSNVSENPTIASSTVAGSIKVGNGLSIDANGTLSVGSTVKFVDLVIYPSTDNITSIAPVGGYPVGAIELYQNVVLLYPNDNYTATDGVTINFIPGTVISNTDKLLLRRWTVPVGSLFTDQRFYPSAPTQTFAVDGNYVPGAVCVYYNGFALYGHGDGFVANDGINVVTVPLVGTADSLLVRKWTTDLVHPFNELVIVPTTTDQTIIPVVNGYTPGSIELYLNGVLLYGDGDNYTANTGTMIVMTDPINPTDTLLMRKWTMWS